MSYKLNKLVKKLSFIGLTSAAIIVSGTTYANKYISSAEKYLENNEINAAIIELKNAIKSSPKDAQPRIMLGEVYLNRGNLISAEKELVRAIELGGEKSEVLPLLVRAISGQGRKEEAIETVDENPVDDPYAKTELLALKALAELGLGKVKDAEFTLQLAKDTSVDTIYSQLGQAQLSAAKSNNNIHSALETIDKILEQDNTNSDVWLTKGHLETRTRQYEKAAESYAKAYEFAPDALHYTVLIARTLVLDQKYDQAEEYVDRLLEIAPNHVLANELKATILYSREDFTRSKDYANRAINNGSKQTATFLISGVSAFQLKLYEQANTRFRQIDSKLPADHFAKRLYIYTQLHLGYINEAIESMNKLDIDTDEDSLFLSKASIQLAKIGRDEEALKLAQKASSANASNANELMLGLVKLSGDDKSGFDNIKSAIKDQPDIRKAELGLAQYYLKIGELEEAEAVANQWLDKDPKDVYALALKGMVYQTKKELDTAKELFEQALANKPDHLQSMVSLAQIEGSDGNWDKAYDYAYKAMTLSPTNNAAFKVLLVCAKQTDQVPAVLSMVDTHLEKDPSNVLLKHQKARAMAVSGNKSEAVDYLESIKDTEKLPSTWSLLGDIYFTQENWFDAERAYARWLKLAPTKTEAYIKNIQINERIQKPRVSIKVANNAMEVFPNDVRFPLLKAALEVKIGEPDSAQRTLNGLNEKVQNTFYALKVQGLIYLVNKEFDKAVTVHEKRYQMQPGLMTANALSTVYVLNNENQKAIDFLTELIEEHPEKTKPLQLKLADIVSKTHPDKAIDHYSQVVEKDPKNAVALNNLAWLYLDNNQPKEALTHAQRAYDLAGKNIAIKDTYGYVLLKNGQAEGALKVLQEAYQKNQQEAEIALHFAESLIANKQVKQAKVVLANVDTESPELIILKGKLEQELTQK